MRLSSIFFEEFMFFLKKDHFKPKSVFITGASSGVGAALALHYAAKDITLHLCGRNRERLEQTADHCRSLGATVFLYQFDTTDSHQSEQAIQTAAQKAPFDLLIANAGISAGSFGKSSFEENTRAIFNTNIDGVMNVVLPTIALFKNKRFCQIAVISSIAGFHGLSSCPAYSASKACVRTWGVALRGALRDKGFSLSVVCPGFIKTPLTDANTFKMPFIMSAEKAANIIARGLTRKKALIVFPKQMAFLIWLAGLLPQSCLVWILDHLPKKES